MSSEPLRFSLSRLSVQVSGDVSRVRKCLIAEWGSCMTEAVAPARELKLHMARGRRFTLRTDESNLERFDTADQLLLAIEARVYGVFVGCHAQRESVLHAALLAYQGVPVLLTGPSGSGKSTLSAYGLRFGFDYMADELSVTDGASIWGVPRAIQFEPIGLEETFAWLPEADLSAFHFHHEGGERVMPIVRPPDARIRYAPLAAKDALVICLERGEAEQLTPLPALDCLATLHEQRFGEHVADLGRFVGAARNYRLTWHDPEAAIASIRQLAERHKSQRPPTSARAEGF